MTNTIYIATSLDGFIADADGGLEWLTGIPMPEGADGGFAELMGRIDGIVMGRNTFEQVVEFGEWPYTKPVFVLSRTVTTPPDGYADRVTFMNGEPPVIVHELKARGFDNLYVDGGVTASKFLESDLIDELIVTRASVVLGQGIPLFSNISTHKGFSHVKTVPLSDLLVTSHYVRIVDK